MPIYYRNFMGEVAEFDASRGLWVSHTNGQSFSDADGKPYGFDVGYPGRFVERREVTVDVLKRKTIKVEVFATKSEFAAGTHLIEAERQARVKGFEPPMVFLEPGKLPHDLAETGRVVAEQ